MAAAAAVGRPLGRLASPLVICGPSGVGKGTLIRLLTTRQPGRFGLAVSHTTRKPRPNEQDGKHYHFVNGPVRVRMCACVRVCVRVVGVHTSIGTMNRLLSLAVRSM
jgi:ABC-type molybdenum transport system ATPase subunit/photorepair protein PhrA